VAQPVDEGAGAARGLDAACVRQRMPGQQRLQQRDGAVGALPLRRDDRTVPPISGHDEAAHDGGAQHSEGCARHSRGRFAYGQYGHARPAVATRVPHGRRLSRYWEGQRRDLALARDAPAQRVLYTGGGIGRGKCGLHDGAQMVEIHHEGSAHWRQGFFLVRDEGARPRMEASSSSMG